MPRVLGQNDGDLLERFDSPKRKIPHVANGGAYDIQPSGLLARAYATFHGILSKSPAD